MLDKAIETHCSQLEAQVGDQHRSIERKLVGTLSEQFSAMLKDLSGIRECLYDFQIKQEDHFEKNAKALESMRIMLIADGGGMGTSGLAGGGGTLPGGDLFSGVQGYGGLDGGAVSTPGRLGEGAVKSAEAANGETSKDGPVRSKTGGSKALSLPVYEDAHPHKDSPRSPRSLEGMTLQEMAAAVITSRFFEALCAFIICLNALHITVSSELAVAHALEHIGGGAWPSTAFLDNTGLLFFLWYLLELIVKLFVYRTSFFTGPDRSWNYFDIGLVLSGMLGLLETFLGGEIGLDVTWLRLLRLLKMLKMLRIIRVMRCFRELRVIMHSLAGSLSITLWSLLMLFGVMFVFGISFLQGMVGYLNNATPEQLSAEELHSLRQNWSTVLRSMLSLFAVVTGGMHWNDLADQLQPAGAVYYILFILFVGFTSFAVMNVITGIVVDAALKTSQMDYDAVVHEVFEKNATAMAKMKAAFGSLDGDDDDCMSLEELQASLPEKEVQDFLLNLDLEPDDTLRLHRLLQRDDVGRVPVDEFIAACMKVKGPAKSLDIVCLMSLHTRTLGQMSHLMEYVEDQFSEIHDSFAKLHAHRGRACTS